MNNVLLGLPMAFDIGSFLENVKSTLINWGGIVIMIIGVIMVLVSVWMIGSGLWSHGKKQTNWVVAIALLLIGGAIAVGGWNFVSTIAEGGKKTIEDLGGSGDIKTDDEVANPEPEPVPE